MPPCLFEQDPLVCIAVDRVQDQQIQSGFLDNVKAGEDNFHAGCTRTAHIPVMCRQLIDIFTWNLQGQLPHVLKRGCEGLLAAPIMPDQLPQGRPLHFLDATFGRGGHTRALLAHFPGCRVTALDRDTQAIAYGHSLQQDYPGRLQLIHTPFSALDRWVGPEQVDGIIMDFGVSSPQLDDPQRGFSFQQDGPLDMRMDPTAGPSAADLVHTLSEKDLADLLFTYGQERQSRRIARAIVHDRHRVPFTRTDQLAQLIVRLLGRRGRIHPATRTFQALRIAVNNELEEIQTALPLAASRLRPGGVLMTIAFHSLEDRLAKLFFKDWPDFDCYTKKPLFPTVEDMNVNPRSRSACLRFGRRRL